MREYSTLILTILLVVFFWIVKLTHKSDPENLKQEDRPLLVDM